MFFILAEFRVSWQRAARLRNDPFQRQNYEFETHTLTIEIKRAYSFHTFRFDDWSELVAMCVPHALESCGLFARLRAFHSRPVEGHYRQRGKVMRNTKCAWLTIAALVAGLGVFGSASAFNPQPEPPLSMPVGLTDTESVAIHVSEAPDPTGRTAVIPVTVGLFDASGNLLLSTMIDVAPGKVGSLAISGEKLGIPPGGRMTVYAVTQCRGGAVTTLRCAQSVNSSMELFDTNTGRSSLVVPFLPAIVPVITQ